MASEVSRRLRHYALGSVLAWAGCGVARADTEADARPIALSPAQSETARELMVQGRAHRREGRLAAALESFRAADTIARAPTSGLAVARTLVDLGELLEAHAVLVRLAREPAPKAEPDAFRRAREEAAALGEIVERRLARVRLRLEGVPPTTACVVTLDDHPLSEGALGAPIPLDPGHHEARATALGREVHASFDVVEGARADVWLTFAPAPESAAPRAPDRSGDADRSPSPWGRAVPAIAFSVAGAGLVVGTIAGSVSLAYKPTLEGACPDKACPPEAQDELRAAETAALVSTVAFVTAAAGATTGALVWWLGSRSSSPVRASVGPSWVGVVGRF